jgi:hypothetical protein
MVVQSHFCGSSRTLTFRTQEFGQAKAEPRVESMFHVKRTGSCPKGAHRPEDLLNVSRENQSCVHTLVFTPMKDLFHVKHKRIHRALSDTNPQKRLIRMAGPLFARSLKASFYAGARRTLQTASPFVSGFAVLGASSRRLICKRGLFPKKQAPLRKDRATSLRLQAPEHP